MNESQWQRVKSQSKNKNVATTWIVGFCYNKGSDSKALKRHVRSFLRLTYRRNFPPMKPYDITSDSGWGCMLRSAQMLLATALLRHYLGNEWRLPDDFAERRRNSDYCAVLQLFLDYPGSQRHMYAIHNMVQAGQLYDKLPGEWFGPSTAALVLRDLSREHRRKYSGPLEVYATLGDTIFISEVEEICHAPNDGEPREEAETEESKDEIAEGSQLAADAVQQQVLRLMRDRDRLRAVRSAHSTVEERMPDGDLKVFYDPLLNPPPSESPKQWKCALVVCVPLRLGLHSIDRSVVEDVKEICRLKWFIGFIGGKVNRALYFPGYREPQVFLGLDPHTTFVNPSQPTAHDQFPSVEHFNQIHVNQLEELDSSQLDPSMAFGFYFRNSSEFSAFRDEVKELSRAKISAGKNFLFQIEQFPPNYDVNFDLEEPDMEEPTSSSNIGSNSRNVENVENDEFVLI